MGGFDHHPCHIPCVKREPTSIIRSFLPLSASFIVGTGRMWVSFIGQTVVFNGMDTEFQFAMD